MIACCLIFYVIAEGDHVNNKEELLIYTTKMGIHQSTKWEKFEKT